MVQPNSRLKEETLRTAFHTDTYVDDICVHSSDFEIHIADYKSELEALSKRNVQLRRDKCL